MGNKIWEIIYNGPYNGWDNGLFLNLDNLNNIYILGTSQSSSQISDYVVIKYSQPVGIISQKEKMHKYFKLYQNYPNCIQEDCQINIRRWEYIWYKKISSIQIKFVKRSFTS